jgi:hypothetical protein
VAVSANQILEMVNLGSEILSAGAAAVESIRAFWDSLQPREQTQVQTAQTTVASQGQYNDYSRSAVYQARHTPPGWYAAGGTWRPSYYFPVLNSNRSNVLVMFYNPALADYYDDSSLPYNYDYGVYEALGLASTTRRPRRSPSWMRRQ